MTNKLDNRGFRRGGRNRVALDCGGVSRAKQQFVDECDINKLMAKHEKGIAVTHLNRYQGQYADVVGSVDYHEACNIVLRAQDAFGSLPSTVRARFDNDAGKFMSFVHDPVNKDEMVKMGLATASPEPVAPVQPKPVVTKEE